MSFWVPLCRVPLVKMDDLAHLVLRVLAVSLVSWASQAQKVLM